MNCHSLEEFQDAKMRGSNQLEVILINHFVRVQEVDRPERHKLFYLPKSAIVLLTPSHSDPENLDMCWHSDYQR